MEHWHPAGDRRLVFPFEDGPAGILPRTAIRPDKALGGGAETWYRMQAAYDLARASEHADRIKIERLTTA